MLNNILALSQELISIKSTPDNPKALEQCLEIALSHLKDFTIERFKHKGVKSALVYNTATRPEKFKIILNGHLDIIPGKDYQYVPKITNNRLYGAGALDMKSNLACMILTFKEIAKKLNYPIALQIVTDEELGGFNSTKHQIDKGVKADFVIAGETTNFNIAHKAKGICWLKVVAKGTSAHGAYPWNGDNAIWKIKKFLDVIETKFPNPEKEKWVTTINLAKIQTTNEALNKIPDDCEIWLDIRYIPEDANTILDSIKEIVPHGLKLEVITKEPPLFANPNNKYITSLKEICEQITKKEVTLYGANGSSDARHFMNVNCEGVEFGAIGGGAGSDDEWIDIPSLEKYHNILKTFLLSI